MSPKPRLALIGQRARRQMLARRAERIERRMLDRFYVPRNNLAETYHPKEPQ